MKESEIIGNIRERLGIETLNEMQRAVAASPAQRITLLSPTGSGKTLAYTIAMLKRLREPGGGVRGVIVAPSRELVVQIAAVVRPVARGYKTVALYGGHSMRDEAASLSVTPDIVIATPGRLLDHINRRQLDVSHTRVAVLDEYDKSLDLGFADDMRRIVRGMHHLSAVILTSATELAELPDYLPAVDAAKAETLDFGADADVPTPVLDVVGVESDARDKLDTAVALARSFPPGERSIFFVNHRESAERLAEGMRRNGVPVGMYHGGLDQLDRENALELLNNGTTPILVSTDLAARGLDIDGGVQAVVHYHIPPREQEWTHRNGRTARMGAEGMVYVITAPGERLPEFIGIDRTMAPEPRDGQMKSDTATLYFNLGRKEKISRGDIVGFLTKAGGLRGDQVGRIALRDHSALVAVPADLARPLAASLAGQRIKGQRVRVTQLKPLR